MGHIYTKSLVLAFHYAAIRTLNSKAPGLDAYSNHLLLGPITHDRLALDDVLCFQQLLQLPVRNSSCGVVATSEEFSCVTQFDV